MRRWFRCSICGVSKRLATGRCRSLQADDPSASSSTVEGGDPPRKIVLAVIELRKDERLVALLRTHKPRQAAEKLAAGGAHEEDGYLMADELGRPYHPQSLSNWFEEKVKDLGLPRIRLHDTRHTAATLMLAAGVPVKVVSEMLGHASISITLDVYAHVLPGMGEQAGAALSESLLG